MTTGPSARAIRRRLERTYFGLLALVALLGVLGLITRLQGARQLDRLSEVTQPLIDANDDYLQEMTNAETGKRGFRLAGDPSFLEPFDAALANLDRLEEQLQDAEVDGAEMRRLIDDEIERAHRWLDEFAVPLVARLRADFSGAAAVDTSVGKNLFDSFREANLKVDRAARAERQRVETEIQSSARSAAVGTGIFLLLSLGIGIWLVRRTSAAVADPIDQMRATVSQLAAGNLGARTAVSGPVEVQELALALNELAASRQEHVATQEEAIRRLEELDRARADFVSSISHELRTPLTSVTGYAEMLMDGDAGDLNDQQAQMVDTIDRNARRLLALVEDLLTTSRIEAGVMTMARAPVDLKSIIGDAVAAIRGQASGQHLSMNVEIAPDLHVIWGDAGKLERVMLNLLSNAAKFTPPDGRIDVVVSALDAGVAMEVRDTGVGIPEAEQSKLFQRFFRSSTAWDAVIPGTGLGLTIVKAIVEAHGGTISFESAPDQGTTFRVELPAGRGSETARD